MTSRITTPRRLAVALALAVALIALGVSIAGTRRGNAAPAGRLGPEGVPLERGPALAPAGSPRPGQSVGGIACGAGEVLTYHVHAHLAIFVDGAPRAVPLGIGIGPPLRILQTDRGSFAAGGECFSYLHTHAADGIVHVEAPAPAHFTLGQFFDVWQQRLDSDHVGSAAGRVTAFVGTHRISSDPRAIQLFPHAQVQLDVGTPVVAPRPVRFPAGL